MFRAGQVYSFRRGYYKVAFSVISVNDKTLTVEDWKGVRRYVVWRDKDDSRDYIVYQGRIVYGKTVAEY